MQATLRTNFYQRGRGRGSRRATCPSSSTRRRIPGPAAAEAEVRDLRLQSARRGRAPAHGRGRARRHPLVRPARGFPHRGPRPDEGAERQEHAHRAGRRQGRLRRQAPAADRHARGGAGRGGRLLPDLHPRPARPHRQHRRRHASCRRAQVVRRDGDDPYLVVAADKGTATFSDIANAISADYGFWLGDAFASGGSAGYDHKKMGITARGAWECVKRHFREMGIDTQKTDFTVAGIGDMSGDVFGNGMLLSRHIRLLAAFDHRHIFLDPDPDPAVSFAERAAAVRAAALELGRLRPQEALARRRRLRARREVDRAVGGGARAARHAKRRARRPTRSSAPSCACRSTCCGTAASAPTSRRATRRNAEVGDRTNDAVRINGRELQGQGGRRRRQPRPVAARPGRIRARRRSPQHRLHRQLRRRQHLRRRGQHQDPAQPAGRRAAS